MARIRTIKPDFFTSDTVSELPIRARMTWIGLWTHCDDYGRCRNNVKLVKAAVWPLDNVSLRDIEEDLEALRALGLIFTYEAAGKSYIQVTSWTEHQKVDRPSKSPIPPPPIEGSRNTREPGASTREELDLEGKGREREGKGTRASVATELAAVDTDSEEPPLKCPEHLQTPNPPPCGRCKDARREHMGWIARRNAKTRSAPRCPTHRGEPAHNCSGCSADLKAGEAA